MTVHSPFSVEREEENRSAFSNVHPLELANTPDRPLFSSKEISQSTSAHDSRSGSRECGEIIRATRYRFIILALFAAFGFINQLQYVAFAYVVRETQAYFNVSAIEVNVLSLLVPIVYVIGVIPGCYVYNKVGLRYGIMIGAGLNAMASGLKFIAVWVPKYPILVVAQVLVAGGQILFLSLPTLIAGIWFPPQERTLATATASLFGFAGMAVGMFYSPHVVSLPDHCTSKEWAALLGSQLGFALPVFLLIVCLVRDKPHYRPSPTSTEDYKLPLLKFIKLQLRDANFVLLTLCFGLVTGFLTAVAGVLPQILEPFGIDESKSGVLAFSGILGGAASCALAGLYVDHSRRYKFTALFLVSLSTVLFLLGTIVCRTVTHYGVLDVMLYVLIPLLEVCVLPVVPVVMELAVELAFPCPETVPSTIVLASMCFFSFVGIIVFSIILGDDPTTDSVFYVLLITSIVSALSAVGLVFVKEKLHRHEGDNGHGDSKTRETPENFEVGLVATSPNPMTTPT